MPMSEESRNGEKNGRALSWAYMSAVLVFSCFCEIRACSSLQFSKYRFADDGVIGPSHEVKLQRSWPRRPSVIEEIRSTPVSLANSFYELARIRETVGL
jgi:hypothetical protein